MTNQPRASVVVLNWNGADLLREALASLRAQTFRDFEVIVVDNGSVDHTPSVLAEFPEVRVLKLDRNRGFAGGANAGIRVARGSIIALLNNDARAEPRWLEALVSALDRNPKLGSVAARMLLFHQPDLIDAAGDQFGIFASQIGHGQPDGPRFQQPYSVLSACAGAAAYRRSAMEDAGLFDERFFAYLEDVDLGIRLQLAGYECAYVPDAVALHHGSATARRVSGLKYQLLMRNSLYVFFQYMPWPRLLWAPLVMLWPLICGRAERHPMKLIWSVYAAFFRSLPDVIKIRRAWQQRRVITSAQLRALLVSPLTVQGRRPARETIVVQRAPAMPTLTGETP